MPRPRLSSADTGPRDLLSAGSLREHSSLRPIIASRGARARDPDQPVRLSQVRYDQHRASDVMTSRSMYDEDVGMATHVHYDNHTQIQGLGTSHNVSDSNYSDKWRRIYKRPKHRYSHPRRQVHVHQKLRIWRYDAYLPQAPCCYVCLKILQLMACVVIVVVSRAVHERLTFDLLHTLFGVWGMLCVIFSLLMLCTRGYPTPGHCLHVLVLLMYVVTVGVFVSGAVVVLLQTPTNTFVYLLAVLFLTGVVVCGVDVVVVWVALMGCHYCHLRPLPQRLYKTHPISIIHPPPPRPSQRFYKTHHYRHHRPSHNHHHPQHPTRSPRHSISHHPHYHHHFSHTVYNEQRHKNGHLLNMANGRTVVSDHYSQPPASPPVLPPAGRLGLPRPGPATHRSYPRAVLTDWH